MLICYHCGHHFTDDFIEALHAVPPARVTHHGEDGVLLSVGQVLCDGCLQMPVGQLAKVIEEMTELAVRKHFGGLS